MKAKRNDMADFEWHAIKAIREMCHHLTMGCRPELAAAMAITAIGMFQKARQPHPRTGSLAHSRERIEQAIQIAIHHYGLAETIAHVGAESSEVIRNEYIDILTRLTGN